MKILSVSDIEVSFIYSPIIIERFKDTDLVISCGDLPYYYLEYIVSMLNVPVYYVRGNHQNMTEHGVMGSRQFPWGAIDLHRKTIKQGNLLLAGIEGCLQYNFGPAQYSQAEMWTHVLKLVPSLMINRMFYGRYLDVFVSHAPPWGIHDMDDRPHQGIKAFRWLLQVFHPTYHLHGHIHVYRPDTVTETNYYGTKVINTFGFRETLIDFERVGTYFQAITPPVHERSNDNV